MRFERVVLMSPALDQDLGFEQRIEELAVEKLGAELSVEGFDVAVLPRASGLDEQGASVGPDPTAESCLTGSLLLGPAGNPASTPYARSAPLAT